MKNSKSRIIRGALLVAGTSIGGGMLALPVLTGIGGFVPSLAIYFFCWLFMASTGMLLLEVCLWMKGETNLVSMAEYTLGTPGKYLAWVLYLFLFYSLSLAYVVGCGDLFAELFQDHIPDGLGSLFFVLLAAPVVFVGPWLVGRVNTLLMVGLGVTFVLFFYFGIPYVNTEHFQRMEWSLSLMALPVAFTAFAYQGIVPTMAHYMDYDPKDTRLAILIGSVLPLFAYIIWQWLILGIIPVEGPDGIAAALEQGSNAVAPLKNFLDNPYVYYIGRYFAFFALTTSFFGVTLGLFDFLADGLSVKKDFKGKILLCLLVFVPPLIIGLIYPNAFLVALRHAGGLGCALLLGLMPILMVWSGCYRMGLRPLIPIPGGRGLLVALLAFVVLELICDLVY